MQAPVKSLSNISLITRTIQLKKKKQRPKNTAANEIERDKWHTLNQHLQIIDPGLSINIYIYNKMVLNVIK